MQGEFQKLIWLCHEIGREDRGMAILGEGNCSIRLDDHRFAVKASGSTLATLTVNDFVVCNMQKVLSLVDQQGLEGKGLESALMACREDAESRRPSIETPVHGWLLQLDHAECVGHCHPIHCTAILCSPRAEEFATRRLFPDEIVCCGSQSVYVPYADPGISLAREIRSRVLVYLRRAHGRPPRLILLQNHGIIAVGPTPEAVLATLLMAEKAARIFIGAACLGGPVPMSPQNIQRIETRTDEAHRQRQMRL